MIPIGKQDFETLRKEGYAYVDKTRFVYQLVDSGTYFSLSRPRRFGKSLLLSTFKAYFEGKREVFEGLDIARLEQNWTVRPVFYLDLNTNDYNCLEDLEKRLMSQLADWEQIYPTGVGVFSPGIRFEAVIRKAAEMSGHRVAVLVDGYDKPLMESIGNDELQGAFRSTLNGFYGVLKSMDAYIKFAFLTGVTKFGNMSVFGGLNNVTDISTYSRYADICGITEQELLSYFAPEVDALAEACRMTHDECVERLRRDYAGYHFENDTPEVYNPFSVLNTLDNLKFGSYWFESANLTNLVKLLQKYDYNLSRIADCNVNDSMLSRMDTAIVGLTPIIYLSGYLTIKGYDEEFDTYTLGFPNREVEEGFVEYLAPFYVEKRPTGSAFDISRFVEDLQAGDTEGFVLRLRTLIADAPYDPEDRPEHHYQNLVWLLFELLSFCTEAECHTDLGHMDIVVKTPKYCYVVEFKHIGTAAEALKRISDQRYVLPFALDGQQIIRIGISFDKETRNIDQYLVG